MNRQPIDSDKELLPRWNNPLTLFAGALLIADLVLQYLPIVWNVKGWPQHGIDATGFALAALAMLPWVAAHLSSAQLPGGIGLRFREVERRQDFTERAIRQLRFIVDGFLTRDEYKHLLNIQRRQEYQVTKDQSGPLAAELRRLRALGLIAGHGITDFSKPDGQKRKINEWFRLTTRGEEYLQMRTDNERDLFGASEAEKTIAPNPVPLPSAELVGRNDSSERG
jgi:DNA-binding PadR family transcriptional regulator